MKWQDLLDRINNLDTSAQVGELVVPPPELIAFNVRWTRSMRQMKKSSLADLAQVSVSTIERVERAEKVTDECLDRIAIALGQERGYYTAPRPRRTTEEAVDHMISRFGELQPVHVRQLRTQPQIRELAMCDGCLINRPGLSEEFDDAIAVLWEWLDLASFILSEELNDKPGGEGRRRELYTSILGAVKELEKRGVTVLAGVMEAPQPQFPDWKISVVSITAKCVDPGAPKRRVLLIDRRCASIGTMPITPARHSRMT